MRTDLADWPFLGLLAAVTTAAFVSMVFLSIAWPRAVDTLWPLFLLVPLVPSLWTEMRQLPRTGMVSILSLDAWRGLIKVWSSYVIAIYVVSSFIVFVFPINAVPIMLAEQVQTARTLSVGEWAPFSFFLNNNLSVAAKTGILSLFGTGGMYTTGFTASYSGSLAGLAGREALVRLGTWQGAYQWSVFALGGLAHRVFEYAGLLLVGTGFTRASVLSLDDAFSIDVAKQCAVIVAIGLCCIFVGALIEAYLTPHVLSSMLRLTGGFPTFPDDLYALALW